MRASANLVFLYLYIPSPIVWIIIIKIFDWFRNYKHSSLEWRILLKDKENQGQEIEIQTTDKDRIHTTDKVHEREIKDKNPVDEGYRRSKQ